MLWDSIGTGSEMTGTQNQPAIDEAQIARGALRTFFRIVRDWALDTDQAMRLLGLTSRSTYFKWKKDPASARLSPDALERLSYIFGIYKDLQILLPSPESADSWIHRPNQAPPFGGRSALERMLAGHVADLYEVRQYLDAQRGWS